MKAQAEILHNWFEDAKTTYPTLAGKFDELMGIEGYIKNQVSSIDGFTNTVTGLNAKIDHAIVLMLPHIFGGTPEGMAAKADFEKYLDLYSMGQYMGARDWRTDETALHPGGMEGDFATAVTAARGQATADGYNFPSVATFKNWVSDRTNVTIANFNTNSLRGGANDQLFTNFLMSIMKSEIIKALGLDGLTGANLTNADAMAEALIIQIGQDNEEFRALIDDFQKATDLNGAQELGWNYNLSGALTQSYIIAQAQTQSSTHLAHIDAQTQFQPDAVKIAYGNRQEQLPLDAVKPGGYGGEYTGNGIPRKDERAV